MSEFSMARAAAYRQLRELCGLTQEELANRLNLIPPAIADRESGLHTITTEAEFALQRIYCEIERERNPPPQNQFELDRELHLERERRKMLNLDIDALVEEITELKRLLRRVDDLIAANGIAKIKDTSTLAIDIAAAISP